MLDNRDSLKVAVALVAALVLYGCSLNPKTAVAPNDSEQLVAQDIVNVLAQMNHLPTASTTLALPEAALSNDTFLQTLRSRFEHAGFAIRTGVPAATDQVVKYSLVRKSDAQAGAVITYTVSVGDVSVRRSYKPVSNGRVVPLAAMQVKGVDASQLRLDDGIFGDAAPMQTHSRSPAPASHAPLTRPSEQPRPPSLPLAGELAERDTNTSRPSGTQPETGKSVRPLAFATAVPPPAAGSKPRDLVGIAAPLFVNTPASTAEFGAIERLSEKPKANFRDLGKSNFANVLDQLGIVNETILTFDNDSLRLGPHNKARVRKFVDKFVEDSDVFSIIGCSNGATSLTMGQEGLAKGRADRVKQELLYAGVPASSILDEACWAEEAFDQRLPPRGVVLTLKRRTS